jgi:pimeloyl-ACP methyl ester carboxylesterase
MAFATLDGIATRYEIVGDGPPLLMFSPGGFDATVEKWTTLGIYARTRMLDALRNHNRLILFDRRECGQSGGRVERVTWMHYAAQAKALLDHLRIDHAHLMGGCMGCAPVVAFAVAYPQAVRSMVLYWPVGGARYRINGQQRFAEHLAFVDEQGLDAVVAIARSEGKPFGAEPRGGPWASVIRNDPDFAEAFAKQDDERYKLAVSGMGRALLDRDTAPGAESEDLLRLALPSLVIPGHDPSHATSAARYLEECLSGSQYWDVSPEAQTADNVPPRLLTFLASAS